MHPYRTFRRFESESEAATFVQFLMANGIPATMETVPPILDRTLVGEAPGARVEVKVQGYQFMAAQRLLRNSVQITLDDIEPDYYLFSFSDKELLDIVHRPDEWGEYDQALAVALLREHGIAITEEQVEAAEEARIAELARPRPLTNTTLAGIYCVGAAGFLISFLGFYQLLHGLTPIALFAGLMMATPAASGIAFLKGRRTLPDGSSAYMFDERTRRHGRIMIIASVVAAVIFVGLIKLVLVNL
ncbi:hypothetical protein DCC81_05230 [Chitinophaga parva]|uniref:Uncharacterized protein n=1 Tax=Chitinophaga parva TaxID=2169414 RepID=A0A2T7BMH3_9BACT|nr:hypothetical protein [Chitinophaga parva]PUZ28883.1 hypothetical protein DCC81_05230 [Chitinophaga parva]